MLLGDIILLVDVALEGRKDLALAKEPFARQALQPEERAIRLALAVRLCSPAGGRDDEILELLAEDDDALLEQERVGRPAHARASVVAAPCAGLDEGVLGREKPAWRRGRAVEVVGCFLPEVEDEAERSGVELRGEERSGEGRRSSTSAS